MVGMIIIGPMAEHDVGFPLPNEAGKHAAIFEGGKQFAVMNVENDALHAENLVRSLHFVAPAQGQGAAGFAPMADIAIGHRHEQDMMAFFRPHGSCATYLKFAVIRMRPETDDAEFAVVRWHGDAFDGAEAKLSGGEQCAKRNQCWSR